MSNRNTSKRDCDYYSGYRHPKSLIGYVVWQYHRFMLSLRAVSGPKPVCVKIKLNPVFANTVKQSRPIFN